MPMDQRIVDLLQICPLMPPVDAALAATYAVHRLWQAEAPDALLADVGARVRAVATGGGEGVDRAVLAALPNCEIISVFGVGVDAIPLDEARTRGIVVTNTPDVLTDDVADLAVGLVLAVSRGVVQGDRWVRDGHWATRGRMALQRKVAGKRIGIFGLGRVGLAIARRLQAFDCAIGYTDLKPRADVDFAFHADVTDLAAASDVVVIAAAGGPSTHNLIGPAVLDALGPEGILVNVARGSILDEAALVAALEDGRLGGAGLDVFADEPHVPDALQRLPNVVLQPHQASATVETRGAMGRLVLDNLAAHFSGTPHLTRVV